MIRIIPNILSCFRLILAFVFPFCPEHYWLWLIICGGGSDFLDGWVARRWNVSSWKGRVLDAIADKLFVLSVLAVFVWSHKIAAWMVPAVIARDLMMVVIAGYTHYRKAWDTFKRIKSRWSGKIATAGQFLLFVTVALQPDRTWPVLVFSIFLSISAALDYGLQFRKALQGNMR